MSAKADIDRTVRRMWGDATQEQIAAAAGVDKSTVSRRAAALGLNVARPGLAIDGRIRELWPDLDVEPIAAQLGVEVATVKRRAKALGLPQKSSPSLSPSPAGGLKVKPAPRPLSGGNLKRKLNAKAEDTPRLEFAPLPPVQPAGPGALILADAPARGACRFPVGEAPEGRMDLQRFCCAPAKLGPYCAEHTALVSGKSRRKR